MSDEVPGTYWQDTDGLHVDTRGLGPPDPLIAILWHISQPGQTGPIFAHFDRHPIYLLPELAERGWQHDKTMSDPDNVVLILRPRP